MSWTVEGGIEWELNGNRLTIRAATTPESGYQKGKMKNYTSSSRPGWDSAVEALPYCYLTLNSGITYIGSCAFYGRARKWTGGVVIPGTVTVIGTEAFGNSSFDGKLEIEEGVITVSMSTFAESDFSGALVLPNSLRAVASAGFLYGKFTVITIGTDIKTLGINAFLNNSNCERIILKGKPTTIDSRALDVAAKLTEAKTVQLYSKGNWALENIPEYEKTKFDYRDLDANTGKIWMKISGQWRRIN